MADDGNTSRFVQFDIDSNLASGVAALLLDILLLTFIKFQAQLLCSTANVYLVYDKRRAVSPTKSSLSGLTGGPVGPMQLARFFSTLIGIVTVCVIILGFSINGKTVEVFQPRMFRSLVEIKGRPVDIDYNTEFERRASGTFVSKRLAAMSNSYVCQRNNYTHTEIYAHAYNETLGYEMVSTEVKVGGAECVEAPLFKSSKVARRYPMSPQFRHVVCRIEEIQSIFSDDQKNGTADYSASSCELEIARLQCFQEGHTACAAVGKERDTGFHYMYLMPDIKAAPQHEVVQIDGGLTPAEEEKLALNVAFLSVTGFSGGVPNLANVAITSVSYNQTLQRGLDSAQQVSEVDLRLAVPLLAVVSAITIVLSITSICCWMLVVYLKGRSGYNKFSTVSDMLEFANGGVDGTTGRHRKVSKEHPHIGISRSFPNLVVVGENEKDSCSNSKWEEDKIGAYLNVVEKHLLGARYDDKYEVA